MFKSKHSGWTWDLKRTPFGGGNPLDAVSSALGTDGGDGGLLGGLADIDPGPALGSGLAETDKFVGNVIPGGWGTLGTAVATYFGGPLGAAAAQGVEGIAKGEDWDKTLLDMGKAAALAYAGGQLSEALNFSGAEQITTDAGKEAFFDALSKGASSSDAISTGLVADGAASAAQIYDYSEPLYPEQFGPTYQELGVTGVEGGFAGPTYAELGYTGLNQAEAIAAADAASAAASQGLSAKDVLTNANRAKKIADLLNQSNPQANINPRNIPNANQWATQAAQNFAQATPEQFGGLYNMNQNPFTFQNPLINALAGKEKQAGIYDVSGTQGQALNTQNQTANLLRMFG
jgi:hypothetical protein